MVHFLHRVLWKQVLVLPDALDDAQDRCVVQVSVAAVRVPRSSARLSCGALQGCCEAAFSPRSASWS